MAAWRACELNRQTHINKTDDFARRRFRRRHARAQRAALPVAFAHATRLSPARHHFNMGEGAQVGRHLSDLTRVSSTHAKRAQTLKVSAGAVATD